MHLVVDELIVDGVISASGSSAKSDNGGGASGGSLIIQTVFLTGRL